MKTTEEKNTRRFGAPNIACLHTSDGGDCARKVRSDAPAEMAADEETGASWSESAQLADPRAGAERDQGDRETYEGHGSGIRLELRWQICHEEVRKLDLDRSGNATVKPVLHTLDAPLGLVIAQKLGDLGRATESFDAVFVGHSMI